LFILINPVGEIVTSKAKLSDAETMGSLSSFFAGIVPSNLAQLFGNNSNIVGIIFFSILLGVSILYLPEENKNILHNFFYSFFSAILKITSFILFLIPIGIWAFVNIFVKNAMSNNIDINKIMLYVLCVVLANVIQGLIFLPILLKIKKISPIKLFNSMSKMLTVAFFSKSSNVSLPFAIENATSKAKISKRVASFSFPLCSTINMNGCAAFILITVLFVAISNGFSFSYLEMALWVVISCVAAIGNAGIPMGCYFLSSAFLASMHVPLYLMGVILPIYTFIDMIETALNMWSDSCIAAIVDKELNEKKIKK
jgi:Na+/H+-dicarboxylate symporter